MQSNYTVNFDPEIVIVDSDPETRVLTQNFTLTYTISSATELQLNKSLGQVDIRDPFETVQVGNHTLHAFLYMVQENKNIRNVKRCRDGMLKSMQTR